SASGSLPSASMRRRSTGGPAPRTSSSRTPATSRFWLVGSSYPGTHYIAAAEKTWMGLELHGTSPVQRRALLHGHDVVETVDEDGVPQQLAEPRIRLEGVDVAGPADHARHRQRVVINIRADLDDALATPQQSDERALDITFPASCQSDMRCERTIARVHQQRQPGVRGRDRGVIAEIGVA